MGASAEKGQPVRAKPTIITANPRKQKGVKLSLATSNEFSNPKLWVWIKQFREFFDTYGSFQ